MVAVEPLGDVAGYCGGCHGFGRYDGCRGFPGTRGSAAGGTGRGGGEAFGRGGRCGGGGRGLGSLGSWRGAVLAAGGGGSATGRTTVDGLPGEGLVGAVGRVRLIGAGVFRPGCARVEVARTAVGVLSAPIAVAAMPGKFGDRVGELPAGVVTEFSFKPPEQTDGHCGDDGDHEQSSQRVGHADLVGVAAAGGHFQHDDRGHRDVGGIGED